MDVFDLQAKLTLDSSEYDAGLKKASSGTSRFADNLKANLASEAIKFGTQTIVKGFEALVDVTKKAVASYGQYEQLVGGIETLYKTSADTVLQYADQAYKTAGMSANQYMETATGFAASLVQSLGGDTSKAAEYANMAITDMADNANKMGTDMASIQNAYQGFAKQNFTMLDNLKLGYGGTKQEMQRLIDDANALREAQGLNADLTIDSYADIVEAIHTVQTEMGITGTTAAEASGTIEGSLASAKAAWENLLTGLAGGDKDVGALFENFFDSVVTAAENIIPAVGSALSNIAALIVSKGPELAQKGIDLILKLGEGIANGIPNVIAKLPEIITGIVTFISTNLPRIIEVGIQIIGAIGQGLVQAIPQLIAAAPQIIQSLWNALVAAGSLLVQAGLQLLNYIKNGIISAAGQLVAAGKQVVQKIAQGITSAVSNVINAIKNIINRIKSVFTSGNWASIGKNLVLGIARGIANGASAVINAISNLATRALAAAKKFFGIGSPSKLFRDEVGVWIGLGVAEGIEDSEDAVVKAAKQLAEKTYSTSAEWLRRQTKFNRLTLQEQLEVWQEIQSQYIRTSKQWIQAEEEIFDLREKIAEEHAKAETEAFNDAKDAIQRTTKFQKLSTREQLKLWEDLLAKYSQNSQEYLEIDGKIFDLREDLAEDYQKTVEDIWKSIESAYNNYTNTLTKRIEQIAGAYDLFDDVQDRSKVNSQELVTNLQRQVNVMNNFYSDLDKLAERGATEEMIEEIREMGPKAVDQLDALLAMTEKQFGKYTELYGEKQELANKTALKELKGLKEDTAKEIRSQLDALDQLYAEDAPILGKTFVDGVADGIKDTMGAVISAATKLAQEANAAFYQTLNLSTSSVRSSLSGVSQSTSFAKSSLAGASSQIINALSGTSNSGGTYNINLNVDGNTIARTTFDPLKNYAASQGTPIVAAT